MRLMMAAETCRSSSSSLLMIFFLVCQYFFQTSLSCTPSSCGIIRNISYPFRLKDDPTNCGERRAELACENNRTFIYVNSHNKYYVKDINYRTIRVVDASINNNDTCSFPKSSAYSYNFTGHPYPYFSSETPISLMSCPTPLKNSSSLVFTDITHDCASNSSSLARFTYIKVGTMMASEVPKSCRIDLTVMTSWKKFKDSNSNNNVSLSEIHHSILYGFELTFCPECVDSMWGKNIARFYKFVLINV
ncbi:hypothetical protein C2S51_035141 [Perilla frutescens var. frutescens]|nr:hypothetical protein C2S51_035141 [Perilla frutescens var. frutescens]